MRSTRASLHLRAGAGGFTLLELLVVLLLAAIGMAMVLGLGLGPLEGMRLRGAARDLFALCRASRGFALLDRSDNVVAYDPAARAFTEGLRGRSVHLPDDVDVLAGSGDEAIPVEEIAADIDGAAGKDVEPKPVALIVFYADGSADDAVLTLAASGGARLQIRVDPILGDVEIGDAVATP